ncbi:MAG: hypothetical protein PHO08_05965 [Methylococcales bacterium]|nr:hypothetical protein [Methylococcales bacterium]
MIVVFLAQQENEFEALEDAAEFAALSRSRTRVDGDACNWKRRRLLIPGNPTPASIFEDIAVEFSRWLVEDPVMVLVSQVHPFRLNPLLSQGLDSLLAMLILAFPEVRWLFGTILGDPNQQATLEGFHAGHGLRNLYAPKQSPLFDGGGLRDWIRERAIDDERSHHDSSYLPRRKALAIALDEETDYAYLHAYAAYRFGFRTLPLSERAASETVLGQRADSAWKKPGITLALEDVFLNFPDGGRGLSDFLARKAVFPRLEEAEHRILVTSDQRVPGDEDKQARNKFYVNGQKAMGRTICRLHKPHAGLFSVWEESKLHDRLKWTAPVSGKLHRGTGEGFIWPPDWRQTTQNGEGSGHSSPGIFLLIARFLLKRAEKKLADGVFSVESTVQGAVLAGDALELLGGKTPTTAADALSLKHRFELYAECQFTGVEYHIPLRGRLKEIERDAYSIARWFSPSEREAASLNIQLSVVNHLVRILRDYNQYDEEQICMDRVRHLHHTLWMKQHWYRLIFKPLLRYLEWLLRSFAGFVVALAVWIIGLSVLFYWATPYNECWQASVSDAISSFFSIGTPIPHPDCVSIAAQSTASCKNDTPRWPQVAVVCTAIMSGFLHLGVFISHLYSIASRK